PDETAGFIREWAQSGWLNITGGCCGTTPDHIRAIAEAVRASRPRTVPEVAPRLRLSGLEPLDIGDDSLFVNVGERTNVTGSKAFEPVTLVRSPTFTKSESSPMSSGSRPESRSRGATSGTVRGREARTASAIARMWSGVVPQQPPVMLSQPLCAHSRMKPAVSSGCSSYSAIAFGRPAF